jgi:hypothetical protein
MAAYHNVGPLNSSNTNTNTNNNNNNNNRHYVSSTINRDPQDYSSTKYNQQQNYKPLTMPKSHYQNTPPTTKEFLSTDNGTNYLTASSSFDTESNSNVNEPTKRLTNPNGKFSIQKMIRQGFSSWRTKKKPSAGSTPPPPPSITSTNSIYSNTPSSPPPQPLLSTELYMTNHEDLSQIPPPTAVRSISVDSITNRTPPQRIIVTEPVTLPSARANSVDSVTVDFDRPPTATRAYIQSPRATSSTSKAMTMTTTTSPVMTESIPRPIPVPITRILPIQFAENSKTHTPRSPPPPPPSIISPPPPLSIPSTTMKTIETNNRTIPLTNITSNITSNPPKIPPPGMIFLSNIFS